MAQAAGEAARLFSKPAVQSLLRSHGPFALVDAKGQIVQTSSALDRKLPNLAGQTVEQAFGATIPLHPDTPVDVVHGRYIASGGELRPVVLQHVGEGPDLGSRIILVVDSQLFQDAEAQRVDRARDAIRKIALDPSIPDTEARFAAVLSVLAEIIDFDHAVYGVYEDDSAFLYRAIYAGGHVKIKWPSRWLELPLEIKDWLKEQKTWIEDIGAFAEGLPPSPQTNEVVACYLGAGIRSSVTLVLWGAARPKAAFSLCSRHPRHYGEAHLRLLKNVLDLEPVFAKLQADKEAESQAFMNSLERELAAAEESLPQVGARIIDRIARHFNWDHVSLWRINRLQQRFEMVHQYGAVEEFKCQEDARPITASMLGATLASEHILVLDDASNNLHGYQPVNKAFRSAMTAPVRLHGRPRWIVNAEAQVTHAFRGPDRSAVQQIVLSMERGLDQRIVHEIKASLLRETEQGVVVIGLEGRILDLNKVAARLLGLEFPYAAAAQPAALIQDFADDDAARDVLSANAPTASRHVMLRERGDGGESRPVLATRRQLDEVFDIALWFFTDLEALEWSRELRFLRETASELAQQTRVPLALASSLVQRLPQQWRKAAGGNGAPATGGFANELARACERIVAEVNKVDIPFERLAERLELHRRPVRVRAKVPLRRLMRSIIESLPARDQGRIEAPVNDLQDEVLGDEERLAFVIRSVLGHLIRRAQDSSVEDAKVRVQMASLGDLVRISMQVDMAAQATSAALEAAADPLEEAVRAARDDASLALEAMKVIIEKHRGRLETQAPVGSVAGPVPPWTAFAIELPRAAR
jgi:PAS domain-containing protein